MWGDDSGGGVAVTRSNKAVMRFEPIQHLRLDAASLYRLSGDGRLGPLDLLADMIPDAKGPVQPAGLYRARVLPVLDVSRSVQVIKNKQGKVVARAVTVRVLDAGDPVKAATVALGAAKKKSNLKGIATFLLPGATTVTASLTVTAPTYAPFSEKIHA